MYPALVRLDPTLLEAAKTLGASPLRAFFNVVVPALRNTLVATVIMVFVFALGSYLLPQILGRPTHWTLSVLITDQAVYQSNMPFSAAMAVFLVLLSLALVGLTTLVGRKDEARMKTRWPQRIFLGVLALFLAAPLIIVAGVSVNEKQSLELSAAGLLARLVPRDLRQSGVAQRAVGVAGPGRHAARRWRWRWRFRWPGSAGGASRPGPACCSCWAWRPSCCRR